MRTLHDKTADPTIQTTYRSSPMEMIVTLGAVIGFLALATWPSLRLVFGS